MSFLSILIYYDVKPSFFKLTPMKLIDLCGDV